MKFTNYRKYISTAACVAIALVMLISIIPASALNGAASTGIGLQSQGTATIEADPPRLSAAGYVTVTIKLHNPSSSNPGSLPDEFPLEQPGETDGPGETIEPIDPPVTRPPETTPPQTGGTFTNVTISNNYGVSFSTYDVAPGSTGVYSASMMISEAQIGQPLNFTIYWRDSITGVTNFQNLTLRIQRADTAYLRLTRTASVTKASVGEQVVFTYTMVNTGSRRLNGITLIDEKIGGRNPITSPFSLGSGETREVTYTYTMQGASVVSQPKASFTPEGSSTALSVTVSKLTIGLINAQLSKTVTLGNSTPEGVAMTLFLTNNGSQNLSSLVVKDDLGTTLASGFSLAIGESKIIEHFVPNPESVRYVYFTITGSYASGKQFSDNTESIAVRPYIDPNSLGLSFKAEIAKQLNAENHLVLKFTVVNTGRVPYTNVILTEKELGYTLHEIPELAPSREGETFNVDITIDGPRELVFYLKVNDPSGNTYTYDAHLNAEYQDLESAIPNETPEPNSESGITIVDIDKTIGERGERLMKWWRKLEVIFFAALALILILGAIELWLYLKNKKKTGRK